MTKGWAAIALALLAVAAVIAGLAATGGPGQARKERRDRERESDLANLSRLVLCLARENGDRLPATLKTSAECDWQLRLADPFTGAPYRYEAMDARSYRLCADFELPQRPPILGDRDAAGCIHRSFAPDGATAGEGG
ncbi:hypothetical protein SAMN05421641_12235 [Paracoccus thiocyanatus]|uniref:Uncharacterized protein n=1 Tax=Paracoccus thiocyanatus TaxID=34006 RepID=A0A1N6XS12_9RHOB|nr:hypothetical protein [Paracoccus thiocyanatus]SIR05136.1 hypothetical protein SAMN05421641_12235 [Paracoccus thiocyanatus]